MRWRRAIRRGCPAVRGSWSRWRRFWRCGPKYLILDEPTGELDPAGTAMVADALVRTARETGAGILIVEHKTDVLARIADRIVILDGGAVALSGAAADVLADPRLPALGVEPPARVALERAIRAAGIELPAAAWEVSA